MQLLYSFEYQLVVSRLFAKYIYKTNRQEMSKIRTKMIVHVVNDFIELIVIFLKSPVTGPILD